MIALSNCSWGMPDAIEISLEKKEPRGLARRYDGEPDLVEEGQALAGVDEQSLLPVPRRACRGIEVLPEAGALLEDDAVLPLPRFEPVCARAYRMAGEAGASRGIVVFDRFPGDGRGIGHAHDVDEFRVRLREGDLQREVVRAGYSLDLAGVVGLSRGGGPLEERVDALDLP